jgi:serine/threonine protein kinase
MGEVYKATDTRLDRTVAIKVLPEHVASDPELRQRFEREAKALAALSHPHICPVFDVGSQAPSTGSGQAVDFLVMEYLEGETLAQRLAKGALPLDQALEVAIQIADALDKAHRKGIVHRDLKPGNIMLIRSGAGRQGSPQAKLLDFGLAKLRPVGAAGAVALSAAPTVSSPFGAAQGGPLTGAGSILGTIQYMAPEQLEGQEADARTDLFAFGAVVYEMVTGQRAFEGKSQASLIAAILEREPIALASLQPMTPPSLERLVAKCLSKHPDDRWQTAKDLHDELRWVAEGPSKVLTARGDRSSRLRVPWLVAGAAVLSALAIVVAYFRETPPSVALETRLEISTPTSTNSRSFAVSADGTHLLFVASVKGQPRLWLRPLAGTTAQPLEGTEGAQEPFWSPDGRSVGFFSGGQLKRLDLGSGRPRVLSELGGGGGTWNADGVILFSLHTRSPLFKVPASGVGQPVAVTALDQQASHRNPQFLPDGRQFLFEAIGSAETQGIYLGTLDEGPPTRLTASNSRGVYLPSGWLLWVSDGTLVAQPLDLIRRTLTGEPVTVADGVERASVSATGLIAYRSGQGSQNQLVWFDRSGIVQSVIAEPDNSEAVSSPQIAPDGRRVAVHRMIRGNQDIWLLDGTRATRLTSDPADDRWPSWSPDARQIVFDSSRSGTRDLYVRASNGVGPEKLLVTSPEPKIARDWSPDGQFLFYDSTSQRTGLDLWVLPVVGGREPKVFLSTPFNERNAQFSPDGRWVVYMSDESGRDEIYVRPFATPSATGPGSPSASAARQVSTDGGIYPRWRRDGKELYYFAPGDRLMAVSMTPAGSTLEPGTPVELFRPHLAGGYSNPNFGRQYDVARDGRFLINTIRDAAAPPITILQNWSPRAAK